MIHNMKFLLKKCLNKKVAFYYLKKIGIGIGLLLCLSLLSYLLLEMNTKNTAEVVLRTQAIVPTEQNIAEMEEELQLNKPVLIRYTQWLKQALRGEFGASYITKEKITTLIRNAFFNTFYLTLVVFSILVVLSFLIGIYLVLKKDHLTERLLRIILFLFGSIPDFWLGLIFILFFSLTLNWFPTSGVRGIRSLVLPALTLICVNLPSYVRIVRQELIETSQQPFMTYYYLRNFSEKKITYHLLKNSIRASLTSMSMGLPKLIAGSAVVETLFSWPGMGALCVRAISTRDLPLLQAYIVFVALFFMVFNVLIKWINQKIDPRLSQEESK